LDHCDGTSLDPRRSRGNALLSAPVGQACLCGHGRREDVSTGAEALSG
jgi:hypothetical protein